MKEALRFDKWLLDFAKQRYEANRRGETTRTQIAVSLHRRFRGSTLSDRIGRFIPGGTGLWKGDGAEDLDGVDIKCINITKRAIQMNQAALGSATVAIQNEPANKDPDLRGAANVANGITEWLEANDHHWSMNLINRMTQIIQTGYGCFLHSYHDENKSNYVETQPWEDKEERIPGEYVCKCGSGGTYDSDDDETTKCPQCGGVAEVTKSSKLALVPRPGEKKQVNFGDNCSSISSCLEHRVDEKNTQGGNLLLGQWFEHHYLVSEGELNVLFPKWELPKSTEWTYPLRWKYALETGNDVFNSLSSSNEFTKRRELQDWYVLPEEVADRIEPEDFDLKDGQGNIVFSIKRGEKISEKCPNGFMFTVCGEQVAPRWKEVDFRNEWSYCCFIPDAHSFWGQPLVELLQIQDDWNTLYTIDIQHRERNSLNQIIYNSQMFDADSWERDLVPTSDTFSQGEYPIRHYYDQLQAAPMEGAVNGLKFLFEILPYVGGAPPEAIGVDPPGEDNYSAQLLRKQSMLGQLKPPANSIAHAKVRYIRNHLKIAQATWPEERFQYILTRFGEEWKDDDVEAFLGCDIDRDIVTNYIAGTEIPTDFIQRRMDIENALNKFIEAQTPPPKELLAEYFELLNLDYDLGHMEADQRLAESRYRKIKEGLRALTGKVPDQPIIDGATGQPLPSPLVQSVLSHPSLQVKPKEEHQIHIEFYVDKEKGLMAEDMPDLNLIACVDEMIARHESGGVQEMQSQSAQQVAGAAPVMAAQQAMEPQPPDNSAQAQLQAQQDAQQRDQDAQEAEHQRNFEALEHKSDQQHEIGKMQMQFAQDAQLKQIDAATQERMKSAELGAQERMNAVKVKEQAKLAKQRSAQKSKKAA